jgi:hypothetical protein
VATDLTLNLSRRAIYTVYTTNEKNLEGGHPMAFSKELYSEEHCYRTIENRKLIMWKSKTRLNLRVNLYKERRVRKVATSGINNNNFFQNQTLNNLVMGSWLNERQYWSNVFIDYN